MKNSKTVDKYIGSSGDMRPEKKESWEERFDEEYVATGADIEGLKRVDYRQLREHQVDAIKSFITSLLKAQRGEIIEMVEEVRLNTSQSTAIFGEVIKNLQKMKKGWNYKAPEVIDLELKEFIWDTYVGGRIDEKEDIISKLKGL